MAGVGEASLVLGMVSSLITIVNMTRDLYDAVGDETGLPTNFRRSAEKLPLIYELLKGAGRYIEDMPDQSAQLAFTPTLKSCKLHAVQLQTLFERVMPEEGESRFDRYVKAARTIGKGGRVETLTRGILDDLQLLATRFPEVTTTMAKDKLARAIDEVSKMDSSLPDGFEKTPVYAHYGSGTQNNITSYGTQYLNSGSGPQYNGTNHIVHNHASSPQWSENIRNHLPWTHEALFDSYKRQHEPACLPNTRIELLQHIWDWADRRDGQVIFWLNGLAGTGKSTIARTVAQRYSEKKRLGASFFFNRGGGDIGRADLFVTTIVRQLAETMPSIRSHVSSSIAENMDISKRFLSEQWRQLVMRPLSQLDAQSCPSPYILVIDALDECEGDDEIRIILHHLAQIGSLKTPSLRIFLTSRSETPIRYGFEDIDVTAHKEFVLHNMSPQTVDRDITTFLEHELAAVGKRRKALGSKWPGDRAVKQLVQNASGLFIWAATACRFIKEGAKLGAIRRRLDDILQSPNSMTEREPEKRLNEIYMTVLRHSIPETSTDGERAEFLSDLRKVLGCLVILFSTLSVDSLSALLSLETGVLDSCLEDLHSILNIPKSGNEPLSLHHPSFRDFLLQKERCSDARFWVNEKEAHQALAESCIKLLSDFLKQDICEQKEPGILVADVEDAQIEQCIPPETRYACLYWIQHLQKSDTLLCDGDTVHRFLKEHLLHWLEALSWMRKISAGIEAIFSLELKAESLGDTSHELHAFVHDAKRFILYYRSIVEKAPLQLYYAALIFAPVNSIVKRQFTGQVHSVSWRIWTTLQEDWDTLLQTFEGHDVRIACLAFSSDGMQIATASSDNRICLWNTRNGEALHLLKGHALTICSLDFSPDGKQLVSLASYKTYRLWDTQTGETLKQYNRRIYNQRKVHVASIKFLADGRCVASGRVEKTALVWDINTGETLMMFETPVGYPRKVVISGNDEYIVIENCGRTERAWVVGTNQARQTIDMPSNWPWAPPKAFTSDGKLIFLRDNAIQLWDSRTGKTLQTIDCPIDLDISPFSNVAISPSGNKIAAVIRDDTIMLWEVKTGEHFQTVSFPFRSISRLIFSADSKLLAIGSRDGAVRIWNSSARDLKPKTMNYWRSVTSVAISPNCKRIASGDSTGTVRVWRAKTAEQLLVLDGHIDPVRSIDFSPDGTQLTLKCDRGSVMLWNSTIGESHWIQKKHDCDGDSRGETLFPDDSRLTSDEFGWDAKTSPVMTHFGDPHEPEPDEFNSSGEVASQLAVSKDWIVQGESKLLWLPADYRASCSAVCNNSILLGHLSGYISFFELREGLNGTCKE